MPPRATNARSAGSLELGQPRSPELLAAALRDRDPIAYTSNGNRVARPAVLLRRLARVLGRCGITRVADLSHMAHQAFPVFQACRPHIWGHHSTGQNTGSQGKGATRDQAMISCVMEAIESYCAEPRQISLVRGSWSHLRGHQVVVPPERFVQYPNASPLGSDEPLMWAPAHSVELDRTVLVPAEAVFVPFSPTEFATRPHFPRSTNGLASGATVLEAVTHGLYEVLERYFLALAERGEAVLCPVRSSDLEQISPRVRKFMRDTRESTTISVRVYKRSHGAQSVVMAECSMFHHESELRVRGSGCSSLPSVAIERAISEAAQTFAATASASREDLTGAHRHAAVAPRPGTRKPVARAGVLRKRGKRFDNLRDEFRFLVREVHRFGFPDICIVNLTRVEIEIPVVKVLVPGMLLPRALCMPLTASMRRSNRLTHLRYGIRNA